MPLLRGGELIGATASDESATRTRLAKQQNPSVSAGLRARPEQIGRQEHHAAEERDDTKGNRAARELVAPCYPNTGETEEGHEV